MFHSKWPKLGQVTHQTGEIRKPKHRAHNTSPKHRATPKRPASWTLFVHPTKWIGDKWWKFNIPFRMLYETCLIIMKKEENYKYIIHIEKDCIPYPFLLSQSPAPWKWHSALLPIAGPSRTSCNAASSLRHPPRKITSININLVLLFDFRAALPYIPTAVQVEEWSNSGSTLVTMKKNQEFLMMVVRVSKNNKALIYPASTIT